MIGHQLVKGYLMWLHIIILDKLLQKMLLLWLSFYLVYCCFESLLEFDYFSHCYHPKMAALDAVQCLLILFIKICMYKFGHQGLPRHQVKHQIKRVLFQTTYDWLHHWHKYAFWRPDPVIIWPMDSRKLIAVWEPMRNTNDRSSLYMYDILAIASDFQVSEVLSTRAVGQRL